MNTSINIQKLIPVFFVCLFIALIPSFFFWYILLLAICIKAFVILCIIDYIKRTTMRKKIGLLLSVMILAAIASLVILYFLNSLDPNSI